MRLHPGFRFFLLTFVVLVTGAALFSGQGSTQNTPPQRPVWEVQLARNAQAGSNITIQNQCQQPHTFTVVQQQTPFLELLTAPTVNVPGNSSYNLPVRFNTNGMNSGQYQGAVIIKCDTCGKEKTCKQDREILPLRLTVLENVQPPQPTPTATPTPIATSRPPQTPEPTPTPTPSPTLPGATPLPTPSPSPSSSPCCPVSPATYSVTYLGTLPPPGSDNVSIATSINDSQDTVGGSWGKFAGAASHAFGIYPAGAPLVAENDLKWPPVPAGGDGSFAYGVNAAGHVVGNWYIPPAPTAHTYPFWFDGSMHKLTTLPKPGFDPEPGEAFALNIHDDVVGVGYSTEPSVASVYPDGWAAKWPHDDDPMKDHAMINLNTLLPSGSGWKLFKA
jgi:hypothetical protein